MKEVKEKIWQTRGSLPGSYVVILGGTHGDERTGIEAMNRLITIVGDDHDVQMGTLTLVLGNPKAIELDSRGSVPHADLNRLFTLDLETKKPDGTYEDQRARELLPFLLHADILLDIHSTSKPSEPFMCSSISPRHMELYKWFHVDKVLGDSRHVLGGRVASTDEYVDAHGGIGVCFESGLSTDLSRVQGVVNSLLDVLRAQGVLRGEPVGKPKEPQACFEMEEAVVLSKDGFIFECGFGDRSFVPFREGDVLGHHGNKPLIARYDGVVVFPTTRKYWHVGLPVAYLAKYKQK